MNATTPIPPLESLGEHSPTLANIVARTSYLPHPDVVKAVGGVVFPTVRSTSQRMKLLMRDGAAIGMYDDNYTPTVALLWAHGIVGGSRKGWGFAHIWSAANDINSYSHLANLAMIPECFASLTDKDGPLTGYLRWHAWTVYQWKPDHVEPPQMPLDYGNIQWRYFPKFDESKLFIRQRLAELDNERIRILRPIMAKRGML